MKKKIVLASLVVVLVILIGSATFIYRNHSISKLSITSYIPFRTWIEVNIDVSDESGNYDIDGYKDINPVLFYISLDSNTDINNVEYSENITQMGIFCEGDGTHNLIDFTEYYPNLSGVSYSECNFSDDYIIDMNGLSFVALNNNTNVDYKMLEDNENMSSLIITDKNISLEDLPEFKDNLHFIDLNIEQPIDFDFNTFPKNIQSLYLSTSYEGPENEDTIYGLENYADLHTFMYPNAKYITQESYDYMIENDIHEIPEDIEIIE